MEIDVSAKLSASLDTLSAKVAEQTAVWRRIQSALTHTPMDTPIQGSGICVSGKVVFTCGGPSQGRVWTVRRLAVGGPTKAKLRLYATGAKPSTTGNQVTGLVDIVTTATTNWPNRAFYSTHQLVVLPSQKLWVVVVTATAATATVQVDGSAEDYDFAAYRGVVTL